MPWKDLVKNALLGVENSNFKPETISKLEQMGVKTSTEAPRLLADGVAMIAQFRKAGFALKHFEGELPIPSAAQHFNPKNAHLLHLILSGQHAPVLPEYLFLLKKYGKKLPNVELPTLMSLADLQQFWPEIAPLLDDSGYWLLQQHPEWSNWLHEPSQFNWQTAGKSERLAQLQFWRRQSPSFALELLTSSWETESPADKAVFLPCLEIGLSLADEPLLERALDDRRKEVRQAAAIILAKLPGGKLVERMANRAKALFEYKNDKLKIVNLDEPDLSAQRDGILQIHPGWQGGAKAGYLGQIISLVPLSNWVDFFNKTPAEILNLFSQTDWSEVLLQAAVQSAAFHKSAEWATAIFDLWQRNQNLQVWESTSVNHLAKLIGHDAVNSLALKFMKETASLPNEASPVFRLMKNSEAKWNDELSLLIVNRFRMEIVKDYRQFWQLQYLNSYLQMLGLRCNPALFDQLQTGWSNDSVQWRMWEKPVEDMLARVLFRREMELEIRKDA
ncbi:MAG: hypothetical protein GC192_18960 [Bacteroidetes bacterium]|nr:hypothetical protein [Bacteroidota bacterium]